MIRGINHITLSVRSIEDAFAFYSEILGFKSIMLSEFSAYLEAGGLWLALVQGDIGPSENYSHLAWDVSTEDFPLLKERILATGCKPWQENSTEGDSFYFLDPSGNKLEIHCGSLHSRIAQGKAQWTNKVTWFI